MDFARALHELWQHRGWLLLGGLAALVIALSTAYDFVGIPPRLEAKTLALGTASTSLLVDTPDSAITDVAIDLQPLAARAVVFSKLATTAPVRREIARRLGVDEDLIAIEAPIDGAVRPQEGRETRITSILEADRTLRVGFVAANGLPTIQVTAQAPRVPEAMRLADASADAFKAYIRNVQARQERSRERRVIVRQISPPTGGLVAKEVNVQLAVLAFVATFIAACLVILVFSGLARNLRAIRAGHADVDDRLGEATG